MLAAIEQLATMASQASRPWPEKSKTSGASKKIMPKRSARKADTGHDRAESTADLAPEGTGALRGDSGAMTPGLAGVTSAKDLAASIKAAYRP